MQTVFLVALSMPVTSYVAYIHIYSLYMFQMSGISNHFGGIFMFGLYMAIAFEVITAIGHVLAQSNEVVFLWNRTLVAFVDKLSSTTVDFISSVGELKNCTLL